MCCYSLIRLLFLADKINEREKAKAAAAASIPPPGSPPTVFELVQWYRLHFISSLYSYLTIQSCRIDEQPLIGKDSFTNFLSPTAGSSMDHP
jgi:hypothetical protein